MGCIISIKNSTDSTPEIIQANLAGCHWLPQFDLPAPLPIQPWGRKVGWVDGANNYQIDITTRFYFYSENVSTRILVRGNNQVEIDSTHSDHILNGAAWRLEDGEIVVLIDYETWQRKLGQHPRPAPMGRRGRVVVRAGTVASLINKIEQDGGRAHGISVNESTQDYTSLDEPLDRLTSTGGPFSSSKYVAVGWKKDIEWKRGTFRSDPLPDNPYHALMDNLEASNVGGVFQQMLNPNYDAATAADERA